MTWSNLTPAEQQAHPLYGFGGWLIPMFVIMLGLSVAFLFLTTQAQFETWAVAEYGDSLGKAFVARFFTWSIVASIAWCVLLWMALRAVPSFPIATLLVMWPLLLWSNALNIPLIGMGQTLVNFLFWAIVPVAISLYLVFGRRVNVSFRNRDLVPANFDSCSQR